MWKDLEDVMLIREARHKRTNTVWFHSYEVLEESDSHREEVDGGARGWGRGWGVSASWGQSFSLGR